MPKWCSSEESLATLDEDAPAVGGAVLARRRLIAAVSARVSALLRLPGYRKKVQFTRLRFPEREYTPPPIAG